MLARVMSHYSACSRSAVPAAPRMLPQRLCRNVIAAFRSATSSTTSAAHGLAVLPAVLAMTGLSIAHPAAASALTIHTEPANALSLPTWAIHVSSVMEWVAAMALMWKYAEVSGNPHWKGMTWGMMPCLGSAMAACTWHFFYNSPDLDFLVALQAFLTVFGNCTCWLAAYRIYAAAQEEKAA